MKEPFKFIRKWTDGKLLRCEYEASFWDGSRHVRHRCEDVWMPKHQRFLSTSQNVSYYAELRRAGKV